MHIPKTAESTGSAAQVWHGTKIHTSGGLTQKDLMKTKDGRIVSKKKHMAGKKLYSMQMKDSSFRAKWNVHKKMKE